MEVDEQVMEEMLSILEALGKRVETYIESLQEFSLNIEANKQWVRGRTEEARKKDG